MITRRRLFRDVPIRRKFALLLMLSSGAGLVLSGGALIGYAWFSAREAAQGDLSTLAGITADSATAALAFNDERTASEMLSALRAKPAIDQACLYTLDGGGRVHLFAQYASPGANTPCPALPGAAGVEQSVGFLSVVQPVEQHGDRLGWLRLRQNLEGLQAALGTQIGITVAILGVSFLASLSIAWAMQRALVEPLLSLARVARRVAETRDYRGRAVKAGDDEVGRLIDDFHLMLEQIAVREGELETARQALETEVQQKTHANVELEQALARLKDAQAQLVQNERLAALGSLVAGVAHEINTPVGVGVTAASTLADRAATLRKAYQQGALTRSELEAFIAVADESSQIILRNLQRAADLIHSFKQVAVDQTSGERRRFDLKGYVEEVLLSLAPRLKKSGHTVELSCPPGVMVDSYPGALAQILTNLVSNSLVHGYEAGQRGRLRIEIGHVRGQVVLRFADDGCGIPRENLARIYDPFFTTRRGDGGSGLGLNIVHSLVTQMLGGAIEVRSEPGQGTEFQIRFPAHLRQAAA
ncbi:MAG TPA: ATP-binding protein [Candidatus Binatia bacterium]|nr:ATP-binding protein [Candidatus Binatia bacterium]